MAIRKSSTSGTPKGSTANRPSSPAVGDQYFNGTLGRLEIYTGATDGWKAVGGEVRVPQQPTATDVGTNRAFNNAAAIVDVTANTNGGMPTSYTITSTPGSLTFSGASPITATGLNSNTAYTFTATATNDFGATSSASAASSAVTVTSVPQAPTVGTPSTVAGAAFGQLTSLDVPFTANANGGKTVTSYSLTASPGGAVVSGTTSPFRFTGLTGGTTYTFTATATNANGTSLTSSASTGFVAATAPETPTIGTISLSAANTVSMPFTGNNGGANYTGFTVVSSPSIPLTVTGSTSPISVSGSFEMNQSYTFTLATTNSVGTSPTSSSSASIVPNRGYTLEQTYNTSTTYTVPAGTTQLSVYTFSGAASGSGTSGGKGSSGVAFKDYNVSPGQTFAVTIGSSNGTSSFSNLASANTVNSALNSNVAGFTTAAGGAGGGQGQNGLAGANLTLSGTGLTTYAAGGGGGGGGIGCSRFFMTGNPKYGSGCGGQSGGSLYTQGGTGGGAGFNGYYNGGGWYASPGGAGANGVNLNGGGGGGTGGQSHAGTGGTGSAGSGSPGRVYIYGK